MGRVQVINRLFIILLLITIMTVINSNSTSAVDTFQKNSVVELKETVRVNGAVSANTNCNITVYSPINKSVLVDFQPMTRNSSYFNYTLNSNQTNIKGEYTYDVTCWDTSGLNATEKRSFIVNLGGIEPSEQNSSSLSRTTWIFFLLGLVCFFVCFFTRKLPVKITFILFTIWFFLIGINTAFIALQDEIVNPALESFFSFFLVISHYINWVMIFSIGFIWLITMVVNVFGNMQSKKREKYMQYG